MNSGVKQGCPASPSIFALFIDRASPYLWEHWPGLTRLKCPHLAVLMICILLYVDDVALLADSPRLLQQLLDVFGDFCSQNGLRVNRLKSNVLVTGCRERDVPDEFLC